MRTSLPASFGSSCGRRRPSSKAAFTTCTRIRSRSIYRRRGHANQAMTPCPHLSRIDLFLQVDLIPPGPPSPAGRRGEHRKIYFVTEPSPCGRGRAGGGGGSSRQEG